MYPRPTQNSYRKQKLPRFKSLIPVWRPLDIEYITASPSVYKEKFTDHWVEQTRNIPQHFLCNPLDNSDDEDGSLSPPASQVSLPESVDHIADPRLRAKPQPTHLLKPEQIDFHDPLIHPGIIYNALKIKHQDAPPSQGHAHHPEHAHATEHAAKHTHRPHHTHHSHQHHPDKEQADETKQDWNTPRNLELKTAAFYGARLRGSNDPPKDAGKLLQDPVHVRNEPGREPGAGAALPATPPPPTQPPTRPPKHSNRQEHEEKVKQEAAKTNRRTFGSRSRSGSGSSASGSGQQPTSGSISESASTSTPATGAGATGARPHAADGGVAHQTTGAGKKNPNKIRDKEINIEKDAEAPAPELKPKPMRGSEYPLKSPHYMNIYSPIKSIHPNPNLNFPAKPLTPPKDKHRVAAPPLHARKKADGKSNSGAGNKLDLNNPKIQKTPEKDGAKRKKSKHKDKDKNGTTPKPDTHEDIADILKMVLRAKAKAQADEEKKQLALRSQVQAQLLPQAQNLNLSKSKGGNLNNNSNPKKRSAPSRSQLNYNTKSGRQFKSVVLQEDPPVTSPPAPTPVPVPPSAPIPASVPAPSSKSKPKIYPKSKAKFKSKQSIGVKTNNKTIESVKIKRLPRVLNSPKKIKSKSRRVLKKQNNLERTESEERLDRATEHNTIKNILQTRPKSRTNSLALFKLNSRTNSLLKLPLQREAAQSPPTSSRLFQAGTDKYVQELFYRKLSTNTAPAPPPLPDVTPPPPALPHLRPNKSRRSSRNNSVSNLNPKPSNYYGKLPSNSTPEERLKLFHLAEAAHSRKPGTAPSLRSTGKLGGTPSPKGKRLQPQPPMGMEPEIQKYLKHLHFIPKNPEVALANEKDGGAEHDLGLSNELPLPFKGQEDRGDKLSTQVDVDLELHLRRNPESGEVSQVDVPTKALGFENPARNFAIAHVMTSETSFPEMKEFMRKAKPSLARNERLNWRNKPNPAFLYFESKILPNRRILVPQVRAPLHPTEIRLKRLYEDNEPVDIFSGNHRLFAHQLFDWGGTPRTSSVRGMGRGEGSHCQKGGGSKASAVQSVNFKGRASRAPTTSSIPSAEELVSLVDYESHRETRPLHDKHRKSQSVFFNPTQLPKRLFSSVSRVLRELRRKKPLEE